MQVSPPSRGPVLKIREQLNGVHVRDEANSEGVSVRGQLTIYDGGVLFEAELTEQDSDDLL
eukprot:8015121-Pyramimonas_sp.AAC.1